MGGSARVQVGVKRRASASAGRGAPGAAQELPRVGTSGEGAAPVARRRAPAHARVRILLLAPVFAPQASIGARRWVGLAPWLAEHGFDLDVVCRPPPAGRAVEPALLQRLPQGTRIIEIPPTPSLGTRLENAAWQRLRRVARWRSAAASHPRGPAAGRPRDVGSSAGAEAPVRGGLRDWMRGWWAFQEYASGWRWSADAAAAATALLGRSEHGLVVTSGPPHTVAEAGVSISRARGIPFVLDLRDPWALQPRVPDDVSSPVWYELAARGEARAVHQASLVTVTSDVLRERMAARYPEAADRMVTVTNGFDSDPLPDAAYSERLRICFAGTLYLERDPRPLFDALARAVQRARLTPQQVEVVLMGDVGRAVGCATRELARRAGVEEYVHLLPRGSYQAAQQLLASSQLLVILPWGNDLAIPAKLFDYARHRAWVLAFAPPQSGLARILQGTHADVVAPDDVEAAAQVIERRLAELHGGARPSPLGEDPRFSRRHQAERLVTRLRPLLEPAQPRR